MGHPRRLRGTPLPLPREVREVWGPLPPRRKSPEITSGSQSTAPFQGRLGKARVVPDQLPQGMGSTPHSAPYLQVQ